MSLQKSLSKALYQNLSTKTKAKLLRANTSILLSAAAHDISHSRKKMAIAGLVIAGLAIGVVALARD